MGSPDGYRRSHNIETLLKDLGHCEILAGSTNQQRYVPATRIRARVVNQMFGGATIGNLLAGESKGASRYPNEVRYGPGSGNDSEPSFSTASLILAVFSVECRHPDCQN